MSPTVVSTLVIICGHSQKVVPEYKVLLSAMNEGLKILPDAWFCSKMFGYIFQIFIQLSPMKPIELHQLCIL